MVNEQKWIKTTINDRKKFFWIVWEQDAADSNPVSSVSRFGSTGAVNRYFVVVFKQSLGQALTMTCGYCD